MYKVGLIINPLAGIGGKVGLKGSDGETVVAEAIKRGGKCEASNRTETAIKELIALGDEITFITPSGSMGENQAKKLGFTTEVVCYCNEGSTSSVDTHNAAKAILNQKVDLLLFAGGDGTARDIYSQIKEQIPVIGIPAGVKIHSAVYATSPKSAGLAALRFLANKHYGLIDGEVMDLDENLYRQGIINTRLYGYMKVPNNERRMQNAKIRSSSSQETLNGIGTDIIKNMEENVFYIIGAGSTTQAITGILGVESTLIGVDVLYNKDIVKKDATEKDLMDIVSGRKSKIVLTVIGGQGHVLGRGNQQISPRVIREVGIDNIIIIATKEKLLEIKGRRLLADTGDLELDASLAGYKRVVTGINERVICSLESEG